MKTLEQEYAPTIFQRVSEYAEQHANEPDAKQQYRSMAQRLPILARKAGLAQALAFVRCSRISAHRDLLRHVAHTIAGGDSEALHRQSREADFQTYAYLTHRAMIALGLYKRFAESLIQERSKMDAGEGV